MLAKRLIPCLDVKDNKVVKGVQFRNHETVGDILDLSLRYRDEGADELVFYDITASSDGRSVDRLWIKRIADVLDIPFCVAGGIRSVEDARDVLAYGADKVSINSPALENPDLINMMAKEFGSQCVVVGMDSSEINQTYEVQQYTGREEKSKSSGRLMVDWALEVVDRGAGEIVLNCMNRDGMRQGYDIKQLSTLRQIVTVPIIASGGAGALEHFTSVFRDANVDGALAASVFHKNIVTLSDVKAELSKNGIRVRL